MKKLCHLLSALVICAGALIACNPPEPTPEPGRTVKFTTLVEAVTDFYNTWEDARAIPATVKVGTEDLTISEFIYAEAAALVAISKGDKGDVTIQTYKAASNPDRDSYDQSDIKVTGGKTDGKGVAEDLVTIASRLMESAAEKSQIPNQVLVYRGDNALAFSTNRATVSIARAIAEYATEGKLPSEVSTEYLSASTTLKAFAQQFVGYLDVWEKTVADILSADGSHCEDNGTPWEKVHFIPIPQDTKNDWAKQGSQYDSKYQPYKTIEIEGTTYTAAQCWEIAIRGLMDMCTTEGQAFLETMARNSEIPFGNGKSLSSAPISRPSDACVWGKYPWYESENDGGAVKYKGEPIKTVGLDFILKCGSWHVTRSFIQNANNSPLGMIGNFQQFGTTSSTLILDGYEGLISPMREFLILARFYKYILDNNINKNVYDALKDVRVDFDLYKQELPVVVTTRELTFEAEDTAAQDITLTASTSWTAASPESWIHVNPASGSTGDQTVKVTVDNNSAAEARTGSVNITAGDYVKSVSITQNAYVAPLTGTLLDFAKEFVKVLDVWNSTVGTVDADGKHNGPTAWTNVHFVPIESATPGYTNDGNQYDATLYPNKFSVTVGDQTYTSAQCWEIAQRGMLDLVTKEGSAELTKFNDNRNHTMTLANGATLNEAIPTYSSTNKWGANPWYEYDNTVTYNGAEVTEVGIDFMVKVGAWHVVRSFIKTDCNAPLNAIGNFQEFGTTSGTLNLDGYVGYIAPMRELLILARFYKYLLDNNITENVYDAVKDRKFDFDLYNQGGAAVSTGLKAWAEGFVKYLDVWQNTVGNVSADGTHCADNGTEWENVHFIPIPMDNDNGWENKGGQYDVKYQPYQTVTVGDKTYTASQCWEIAIRGLMNLCTTEGDAFLADMTDRNKAYTLANGVKFSTAEIPATSEKNQWGKYPWYEYDKTVTYKGAAITQVDVQFLLKCGSWHVVRGLIKNAGNSPLNMIGNFQEFGTTSGTLILDGYEGLISPMRELLIAARIYKYILDNNVDADVYDAIKDVKVAFDLY